MIWETNRVWQRRDPCMMTCGSRQILGFRSKVRAFRCKAILDQLVDVKAGKVGSEGTVNPLSEYGAVW